MAKKEEVEALDEEVSAPEGIKPVAHRFGREDMDELVDKLNAVIEVVNNL